MVAVKEEAIVFCGVADEPNVTAAYADSAGYSFDWCPGPDLNRHDLNSRGILSSLSTAQHKITRLNKIQRPPSPELSCFQMELF